MWRLQPSTILADVLMMQGYELAVLRGCVSGAMMRETTTTTPSVQSQRLPADGAECTHREGGGEQTEESSTLFLPRAPLTRERKEMGDVDSEAGEGGVEGSVDGCADHEQHMTHGKHTERWLAILAVPRRCEPGIWDPWGWQVEVVAGGMPWYVVGCVIARLVFEVGSGGVEKGPSANNPRLSPLFMSRRTAIQGCPFGTRGES
ncbi:hypothetical protein B0H67DRAFT_140791 [Lasiosphaeris hirsuta]|uniref:Uncharacterized protein n=1 Tax=Lasiosphaeris hirsuta TaxID=260670 RepID=A0AA40B170_9PEZI|nr:hypothetical protein B0H67DRAFT_140791 [Lasiosphaeris hirsuta]